MQALRQSRHTTPGKEHLRGIYDSTHAIIFLGTPHRGSSYESWGQFARGAATAAGFDANARVLQELNIDSAMLEVLRGEFSSLIDDKKLSFHSFQEAQGFIGTSVFGTNRKVS